MRLKQPGAWGRLYGDLYDHAKVLALGRDLEAMALWVLAASYCARHPRLNGAVSLGVCHRLVGPAKARRWAEALVRVGLWDELSAGEYRFHDYTDWNWSGEDVARYIEDQRERGRRGGRRSADTRRQALAQASASPNAQAGGSALAQATGTAPATAPAQALFKPPADTDTTTPLPPEAVASLEVASNGPPPTRYDWPSREIKAASVRPTSAGFTHWLPGRFPFEAFHHDCPDVNWRGRCVDAAWVTAHPGEPYPASDANGTPKQCPAHRTQEPAW